MLHLRLQSNIMNYLAYISKLLNIHIFSKRYSLNLVDTDKTSTRNENDC